MLLSKIFVTARSIQCSNEQRSPLSTLRTQRI